MADKWADPSCNRTHLGPNSTKNTLDLFFTNNPTCVYNTKVIPGISADGHYTIYIECGITPIRNKVLREIKLYSKTDYEGLKDRMSTVKDSFIAMHSVDTSINSMWNDLMTELERGLDEFVPKKIARTKKTVCNE